MIKLAFKPLWGNADPLALEASVRKGVLVQVQSEVLNGLMVKLGSHFLCTEEFRVQIPVGPLCYNSNMVVKIRGSHPDYPRIEMMLALLGVAINAGNTEHPDPLHREAAQMDGVMRQDLIAGLLDETWTVINDRLPGTDEKPVVIDTPHGTYDLILED